MCDNCRSLKFQSTLPREERRQRSTCNSTSRTFQSTLPREERRRAEIAAGDGDPFQSTLPREERLPSRALPARLTCFNPRSRARSDRLSTA